MKTQHRRTSCLLALALLAVAGPAVAQEEQPAAPLPSADDPLVRALLETRPTTTEEQLRAARTLVALDHPEIAKHFFRQLLAANLDEGQLAGLLQKFGQATFLKFSLDTRLQPEGKQFADLVVAAADKVGRDPARIDQLTKQVGDPSPEVRARAVRQLDHTDNAGVDALIAILADPDRAPQHAAARDALVTLGPGNVPILIAVFQLADPALQTQLIQVFEALEARQSAVHLLVPALSADAPPALRDAARGALTRMFGELPTRDEAAQYLARRAREKYDHPPPLIAGGGDEAAIWFWDPERGASFERLLPPDTVAAERAARLARGAHHLAPHDRSIELLYLGAMLESAKKQFGVDRPLPRENNPAYAEAARRGPEMLGELLDVSLRSGHMVAAAVACQMLGELGSVDLLYIDGARPAPLARAARSTDRRVRFAATNAILALDPQGPFPGSSFVTEALNYFLSSTGVPQGIVVAHRSAPGHQLAVLLAEMGIEAEVVTDGNEALKLSQRSPDYVLMLVDAHVVAPTADEVLARLRMDHRTAGLPFALVATPDQLESARHLVRRDPRAGAIIRPQDIAGLSFQLEALLSPLRREVTTLEERRLHAAVSMRWVTQLAEQKQKLFDVTRLFRPLTVVLDDAEFAAPAAGVLAQLPMPQSQRALLALANRDAETTERRAMAAAAFCASVEKFGVRITADEVLHQFDLYNGSEDSDPAIQQLLGSILDCMEARRRRAR